MCKTLLCKTIIGIEKMTVYAEEIILQFLSRGNEHIHSVNVTWKLQILEPEVK